MVVRSLDSGRYAVDGASGATYTVALPDGDCDCPDRTFRGERCKHLRRVAIEVTEGRVPPPGRRRDRCAGCRREAFVPEDGPSVCDACHPERGNRATDRETGDTVVVFRLTDETAAERAVPGADCTVADYPANDGYPDDDPVVEVVYPFDGAPDADLGDRRRYAFPLSRLALPAEAPVA